MHVGERSALQGFGAPQLSAVLGEIARRPARAFSYDGFPQRAIGRVKIDVDERWRLILNFMIHAGYYIDPTCGHTYTLPDGRFATFVRMLLSMAVPYEPSISRKTFLLERSCRLFARNGVGHRTVTLGRRESFEDLHPRCSGPGYDAVTDLLIA